MTIKDLSSKESLDEIKTMLDKALSQNQFNPNNQADGQNPFIAYKNYLENVGKELASLKGATANFVQANLARMNGKAIGEGALFDPLSFIGPAPGTRGLKTNSLDNPFIYDTGRGLFSGQSIMIGGRTISIAPPGTNGGVVTSVAPQTQSSKEGLEYNLYNPIETSDDYRLVDDGDQLNESAKGMTMQETTVPGVRIPKPDYQNLFERQQVGPDFGNGQKGAIFYKTKFASTHQNNQLYIRKKSAQTRDDVFFHQKDITKGFVEDSDMDEMISKFADDDLYVPFFFQDIRKPDRRIYFRAFIKTINESITPEWQVEKFYGRMDPVGVYMGTTRTFNISFIVAAMSAKGFSAMWRKINNLTKMVYGQYNGNILTKAPVMKVRVGDLFCAYNGSGLSGYISSPLQIEYTDFPWEISKYGGAPGQQEIGIGPQAANISFTFQVIHENQPQIDANYNFNWEDFRRLGSLSDGAILDEEPTEDETETSASEDGRTP